MVEGKKDLQLNSEKSPFSWKGEGERRLCGFLSQGDRNISGKCEGQVEKFGR